MALTLILSIAFVGLAVVVFYFITVWKLFVKAGKTGWACLIPFYNNWTLAEVGGKPGWWGLLLSLSFSYHMTGSTTIPTLLLIWTGIAGYIVFIFWTLIALGIAKNFGKSTAFGFLIVLLPFIGIPILAFGKSEYHGDKTKESKVLISIILFIYGLLIAALALLLAFLVIPAVNRANHNTQRESDVKAISSVFKLYETNVSALLPTTATAESSNQIEICDVTCQQGEASGYVYFYKSHNITFHEYSPGLSMKDVHNVYLVDDAICNTGRTGIGTTRVHSVAILYALEINAGSKPQCSNVISYSFSDANAFPYCGVIPTNNMSVAAYQYLKATITENIARAPISKDIQNNNDQVTQNEIGLQLTTDEQFLSNLSKISFPANASADAVVLENAIKNYDQAITVESANWNNFSNSENAQLINDRSARSAAANVLRQDLNLPESSCSFLEP